MTEIGNSPEKPEQFIIYKFKPEGYVSTGDKEYLDQLEEFLAQKGIDPSNVVYSGFDGSTLEGGEYPKRSYMFAMNPAGWKAIQGREENPAEYAQGFEESYLGVFDKSKLVEAYSYELEQDPNKQNYDEAIKITNIEPGEALSEIMDKPVTELVIPSNYPHGSVGDSLICIIKLEF